MLIIVDVAIICVSPNDSTEHRLGTEIINKLYHHVFNSLVFIYIQVRHRFITHMLYIICKPNPSTYK